MWWALPGLLLWSAACDNAEPCREDQPPGRLVLSLNGTWEVEQGLMGDVPPAGFGHTVPVPALLNQADPPFSEVGRQSSLREVFWYRTTFVAPAYGDVAILNVHKAKYGIAVWLNDTFVGEHLGSYTLASFDVTESLRKEESNTLLIRLGAHLDSVPASVPAGQDPEKELWIPGIYDDVSLVLSRSPRIVRTKIEPDIEAEQTRVITTVRNHRKSRRSVTVQSQVFEWASGLPASGENALTMTLGRREERSVEQILSVSDIHLWSPEDPFLYLVRTEVRCDGKLLDHLETRFGMRKVEWRGRSSADPPGFFLNNRRYFLRGSNITLQLSESVYEDLLGPGPHGPEVYREAYAYAVGGMTEFWRARRGYAGVLHFTYLGYSREDGDTSDNFIDIENLVLEPRWLEYAKNAFAPLAVYLDTWRDDYAPGEATEVPVQVANDLNTPESATLRVLAVDMDGQVLLESSSLAVDLDAYGSEAHTFALSAMPDWPYMIFAELAPDDSSLPTVYSRRKVGFVHIGERGPDPPFP